MMRNHIPSQEALSKVKVAQAETPTLLEKFTYWFRDFLENAE